MFNKLCSTALLPVWLQIEYVGVNCYKFLYIKIIIESALMRST